MSTEVARGSQSEASPLLTELFRGEIYSRNQGRIVRQMTCLAIWVVVSLGCLSLYNALKGVFAEQAYLELVIPGAVGALGLWVGYRLVNWPTFADFLINVEAEMKKVSWPSKPELVRASIVVIFTIFFLAISLYLFDAIWTLAFQAIGISV